MSPSGRPTGIPRLTVNEPLDPRRDAMTTSSPCRRRRAWIPSCPVCTAYHLARLKKELQPS